jgi:hypothetical protein
MRYAVITLLAISSMACGQNRNAGKNANSGTDEIGGDADLCLPGQIRDGYGRCVDPCTSTPECNDPDLICNTQVGLCVPKPPDEVCDPLNCGPGMQCPPPGEGVDCVAIPGWCDEDEDCELGERCEENACISRAGDVIMVCETDADCSNQGGILLTCQAGVCIGCIDNLQCGEGGKCVLGTCVVADLGPAGNCIGLTCPEGTRCSLLTGTCEIICTTDEECGEGKSCLPLANQCVAEFGCDTAEDCQVPQQCIAGLCVGCASDEECKASETCIVGACFPRLDASVCDSVTCAPDELCDPLNGACYPADGTCADSDDCRPGHTCNFLGLCSGCSVDGDCRPNQRCLLATCIQI